MRAQSGKKGGTRSDDEDEDYVKAPGFGDSKTNDEQVAQFYRHWESFHTYKRFMWADEYDSRDAENRWVRRQMEKENEDRRKKEKREYVQTVKQLGNKRGRV